MTTDEVIGAIIADVARFCDLTPGRRSLEDFRPPIRASFRRDEFATGTLESNGLRYETCYGVIRPIRDM